MVRRAGRCHDGRHILDLEGVGARALHPDRPRGIGPDEPGDVGAEQRVVVLDRDTQPGEQPVAQLPGRAVDRVHHEQVIARAGHRQQGDGDGRETGRSQDHPVAALTGEEELAQDGGRRRQERAVGVRWGRRPPRQRGTRRDPRRRRTGRWTSADLGVRRPEAAPVHHRLIVADRPAARHRPGARRPPGDSAQDGHGRDVDRGWPRSRPPGSPGRGGPSRPGGPEYELPGLAGAPIQADRREVDPVQVTRADPQLGLGAAPSSPPDRRTRCEPARRRCGIANIAAGRAGAGDPRHQPTQVKGPDVSWARRTSATGSSPGAPDADELRPHWAA